MHRHRTLESLVKETLEAEPSPSERDAVWATILARVGEGEAWGRAPNLGLVRRRPRLPHPAVVGVAVGVIVLAVLALLPTPQKPREPLPRASSAEGVAVLNATASSTRSALPAVGPGERLYTRTSTTIRGEGRFRGKTESWTATDGSALIVQRSWSGGPCPPQRAAPCWRFTASTTRYQAGSDVGVLSYDGRESPVRPEPFST
jgi:hypothetical protein